MRGCCERDLRVCVDLSERARELLRRALLPVALPPRKRRRLRERVAGHLRACFPGQGEAAVAARAEAFLFHWSAKFAEDAVALNLGGLEDWRRAVNRRVQIQAGHNMRRALARGRGILVVGCHLGSTSFCTNALLSRTARGALATIRAASAMAASTTSPGSHTALIMPCWRAASASMVSPVRASSIAMAGGSTRGSRTRPPAAATSERLTSGIPNCEPVDATRRSHDRAISVPPATA